MMNINSKKILLVDDDTSILNMLETVLFMENFKNVCKASSGKKAVEIVNSWKPDLIILDIMLPDIDGYEVCKRVRDLSMIPILFLSAKEEENDKLKSFAMGGDDYINKPFSPKELIARISAMLNRAVYYENANESRKKISFGEYTIDLEKNELYFNGIPVDLTYKEYKLLSYLVQNKNIVVSKEQIVANVWDDDYDGYDNTVMVHIRRLREKVEKDPSNPEYIKTIKSRGYRFELVDKKGAV